MMSLSGKKSSEHIYRINFQTALSIPVMRDVRNARTIGVAANYLAVINSFSIATYCATTFAGILVCVNGLIAPLFFRIVST